MNPETEKQKIREVIETWLVASRRNDVDSLLNLMAEDVVFLLPGCEPMCGRAAFAAAARSPQKRFHFVEGVPEIREIEIGEDRAFVWNYLQVTVADGSGQRFHHAGHVLSIFRRESDGRWVLYRDANLLTPRAGAAQA